MAWVKAASLDELRTKPIVFKHPPLQIALFHTNGRIFAVDNRCPHEGYPLASGTVSSECVLTCNWHNWKFRLEDGQCIMGGDNVRAYATRLDGENVWIDVSPLPSEETQQTIMHGLRKAFSERDYGRICREIARLHFNGLDPKDAIRAGIRWSYDRHEPGATDGHAYAGAADWLFLAETFGGDFERRLICYAEAVDHMALVSLRQPEFAYAPPGEPFARDAFLAAIEAEDLSRAEGMVARALADGLHWPDLQEAFVAAALAHYEDFGHSVIYTQKLSPLISELGGDVERCLLLLQARHLCYAMKEDRIPEFKDYSAALEALPVPRLGTTTADDIEIPFPCNLRQSFQWLATCLASGIVADGMLPWPECSLSGFSIGSCTMASG
jgi:nitrite reductase/ring-hydroxylating ferredoxin subunit